MKKIELLKKLGFSDLYLKKIQMIESKQKENEVLNPIENKNIDTYSDNVSTIIITPSDVEPSQNYIYRG
jgi:hypothetical protein